MHEDKVEPLVEFEADVGEVADLDESEVAVEGDAGGLVGGDQCDDLAVAEDAGAGDEVCEQCAAEALAVVGVVDVDGVFDGEAVGGARVERAQGCPGEDFVCW